MQGFWQRLSQPYQQLPTEERLIVLSVVLACLVAIAVYVIRRIRGEIYSSVPPVTDHLSEFRRMRETGQLDEQEYSRVVQTISAVDPEIAGGPRLEPRDEVNLAGESPPLPNQGTLRGLRTGGSTRADRGDESRSA